MAYSKQVYETIVGTDLDLFSKSDETASQVRLSPAGTVTAGTPFSIGIQQNNEDATKTAADQVAAEEDGTTAGQVNIDPDGTNNKLTIEVLVDIINAGGLTVRRGLTGTPKPLELPDGTAVTELLAADRFYDIIEGTTVFFLRPKGGANDIEGWYNPQTFVGAVSNTMTQIASVTGEGWITGFSFALSVLVFTYYAIEVDGVFIAGSAGSGIPMSYGNIPFNIRFNSSFKFYIRSSDATGRQWALAYKLGDKYGTATPASVTHATASPTNTLLNVSGSGWLKSIYAINNDIEVVIDGVTLYDCADLRTQMNFDWRYESSLLIRGSSTSSGSYAINYIPD